MRKLLKVLALTLAVVLGPRIALADVLAVAGHSVKAADREAVSDDAKDRHGLRSAERSDSGPSPGEGRRPTWGFARRWYPTSRSGPGRVDVMRGFGGVALPGLGGEDAAETRSQGCVSPFPGAKAFRWMTRSNCSKILTPRIEPALLSAPFA